MLVLGTGPVELRFAQRLNSLSHTRYVVRGFISGGELDPEPAATTTGTVSLGELVPADAPLPPTLPVLLLPPFDVFPLVLPPLPPLPEPAPAAPSSHSASQSS
jgi:hypothetical protein